MISLLEYIKENLNDFIITEAFKSKIVKDFIMKSKDTFNGNLSIYMLVNLTTDSGKQVQSSMDIDKNSIQDGIYYTSIIPMHNGKLGYYGGGINAHQNKSSAEANALFNMEDDIFYKNKLYSPDDLKVSNGQSLLDVMKKEKIVISFITVGEDQQDDKISSPILVIKDEKNFWGSNKTDYIKDLFKAIKQQQELKDKRREEFNSGLDKLKGSDVLAKALKGKNKEKAEEIIKKMKQNKKEQNYKDNSQYYRDNYKKTFGDDMYKQAEIFINKSASDKFADVFIKKLRELYENWLKTFADDERIELCLKTFDNGYSKGNYKIAELKNEMWHVASKSANGGMEVIEKIYDNIEKGKDNCIEIFALLNLCAENDKLKEWLNKLINQEFVNGNNVFKFGNKNEE